MPDHSATHLVKMANQIAANVPAGSDAERAELTAAHLRRFWSTALRHRLLTVADASLFDLSPAAREALDRLRRDTAIDSSSPD
ncbi:MAG: formate dehydrogenase subunit delta [Pseudomonadota bacterium]|nr:formate dehydrogenase subunit delta [Pseudomonadota bacterium]